VCVGQRYSAPERVVGELPAAVVSRERLYCSIVRNRTDLYNGGQEQPLRVEPV
jgi:hypothetical protein